MGGGEGTVLDSQVSLGKSVTSQEAVTLRQRYSATKTLCNNVQNGQGPHQHPREELSEIIM